MQLRNEQRGPYLLIKASGRLDASWADYFKDSLLFQIREGNHNLLIDAAEIEFLSSAGIRVLLQVYKEINSVKGSLKIVNATDFVIQTLSMSGFQMWLLEEYPADLPIEAGEKSGRKGFTEFTLNSDASLIAEVQDGWIPWLKVEEDSSRRFSFPSNVTAFGIGSAAENHQSAVPLFGEFLAAGGNAVFQVPEEQGHPDYLISQQSYVPSMQCLQVIALEGDMAHLVRFAPDKEAGFYPVGTLAAQTINDNETTACGFVIIGEIEGLVGAALIKSPGLLDVTRAMTFPEVRDWLSFSGERLFARQQVLITGVISKLREGEPQKLLYPLPESPGYGIHCHAVVFPYQPLPNGKPELTEMVNKYFHGPPPLAVMHLTIDDRPVVGLGESSLIRGACWWAPIRNPEVLA